MKVCPHAEMVGICNTAKNMRFLVKISTPNVQIILKYATKIIIR